MIWWKKRYLGAIYSCSITEFNKRFYLVSLLLNPVYFCYRCWFKFHVFIYCIFTLVHLYSLRSLSSPITSLVRLVRPLNPPIAKTSRSQGTITWWQHSGLAAARGCFLTILWFGRVAGTKVIGFSQKNFPGDSTPLPQSARRGRKWPFLDRPFDDPTPPHYDHLFATT